LIAAMQSSIEQAHFVRVVAERLHVPEEAVRAEVAKHPALLHEETSDDPTAVAPDIALTSLEKKVGMLTAYFAPHTPVYIELAKAVGEEELAAIAGRVNHQQELLRFRFEQELGEHTSESQVAEDMLEDIKKVLERGRFKAKFS
jgi:hypothetical protein